MLVKKTIGKLDFSSRANDRILIIACAIADLDNSEHINSTHIPETIQYLFLDREGWAG